MNRHPLRLPLFLTLLAGLLAPPHLVGAIVADRPESRPIAERSLQARDEDEEEEDENDEEDEEEGADEDEDDDDDVNGGSGGDDDDDDDDLDEACDEVDDDDDGQEDRFCADQAIVGLEPGASIANINDESDTETIATIDGRAIHLLDLRVARGQEEAKIAELERTDGVAWAELNFVESSPESRPSRFFPNTGSLAERSDTGVSYGLEQIGADRIACVDGRGVVVAVIDTGVDLNHPDLRSRLAPGWNAFTGRHGGANDAVVGSSAGHGTHVAGIVLQTAPRAKVLPIKALDGKGAGQAFVLARAIFYAIDKDVEVINLSLGAADNSVVVAESIDEAVEAQTVVVASAGNSGRAAPVEYPVVLAGVIGVTATDQRDRLPGFASTNGSVDLAAPGLRIASTFPVRSNLPSRHAIWSGTSMAAPWVAGTVALLLDKKPAMTLDQVTERLLATAEPLPTADTGGGRLDARAAVGCGKRGRR
ncbi:MAG: S8 family serine peptidase [Chloroflexia bacterium]|nr:S8 family serine peptidase [Chloroflexia bacterium]